MRNYPWYRAIWKDYKDKGVFVIGIHTPETKSEHDIERVKKAMAKAELTFPIAIDNQWTMWKRYQNAYWPSVYLVDKEGIARYGWQGELGWKGAHGEILMRNRIDALLKE